MTDEPTKPKCVIMIVQEYPLGGFGFAVSTDGNVPAEGSAMAATTHLWEGNQRVLQRAMEDTFKQSVHPPQLAPPTFQRQQESYQLPNPPRSTQPAEEVLDDVPGFIRTHEGIRSGLVEQVKKMAANGGRASAFLFCAGVAVWLHVQRAGLV